MSDLGSPKQVAKSLRLARRLVSEGECTEDGGADDVTESV